MKRLYLGGEKSGKSALALEALLDLPGMSGMSGMSGEGGEGGLMLATGRARDFGFRDQIAAHRRQRPASLEVVETGLDLPERLTRAMAQGRPVLADSLDFWLFAALEAGRGSERVQALLDALDDTAAGHVILVSCEAGLGPISVSPETRAFVRSLGALNQAVARRCEEVVLVVAGRALPVPGP